MLHPSLSCALVVAPLAGAVSAQQSLFRLGAPVLLDPQVVAVSHGAIADFDLDGIADMAVSNGFLQSIGGPAVFMRLRGNCNLAARESMPLSVSYLLALYKACAEADVDHDGLPDLLTCNSDGVIELFRNGGPAQLRATGQTFLPPVTIDTLSTASGTARTFTLPVFFTTDLDGDGNQDLVAAGQVLRLFQSTLSTGLNVWFGDGLGGFQPRTSMATGLAIAGRAADFDQDGQKEIVIVLNDGRVHVVRVQSQSLMPAMPQALPVTWQPTCVDVRDVDGDHVPDFVVGGSPGTPEMLLISGTVTGAFGQITALPVPAASVSEFPSVRIADMDDDGLPDVLAVRSFGPGTPGQLVLWTGLGGGRFAVPATLALPGSVSLLFHQMQTPTAMPDLLRIADVDCDGNPEVFVSMVQVQASAPTQVVVFPNAVPQHCLVEHRGTGARGSGGVRPRIGVAGGLPVRGNGGFVITLTDAMGGGAQAALLAGVDEQVHQAPEELTLYTTPRFTSAWSTAGSGPGGGYIVAPCPVPDDANLLGCMVCFQWIVADMDQGRAIGLTTSDALKIMIGERRL